MDPDDQEAQVAGRSNQDLALESSMVNDHDTGNNDRVSPTGPSRHPRPLSIADIHLAYEREEEGMINRLNRQLDNLCQQTADISLRNFLQPPSIIDCDQQAASLSNPRLRSRSSSTISSRSFAGGFAPPGGGVGGIAPARDSVAPSRSSVGRSSGNISREPSFRSREPSAASSSAAIPSNRAPPSVPLRQPSLRAQRAVVSESRRRSVSVTSPIRDEVSFYRAEWTAAREENARLRYIAREKEAMLQRLTDLVRAVEEPSQARK